MLTNPAEFRKICQLPKTRQCVADVHAARRNADRLRDELDRNVYRPLLAEAQLRETRNGREGPVITEVERLYLSEDDEGCRKFYNACSDRIEQLGYDVERGYCPALIAQRRLMEAQKALVSHLQRWFPEMSWEALCNRMGSLDEYLSLICGAVGLEG